MSKLALLGGQPVFDQPLQFNKIWPPVDSTTAQRLQDVYYSREWTAFHDVEHRFAQDFADYHGAKYGVFMINGTVTLQCALGAHGIGPGDEVIVAPLNWYATAMAVRHVGACPVFVDIEADTLCMDPEKIPSAITERTKAIMPVHAYSSMADMDRIMQIAKRHNLKVIEDAAHMHGGIWDGKGIGSIGDVGSFSFQHSKTMASGEGGICITSDQDIAERIYRSKHIGYRYGDPPRRPKSGPPRGLMCYNYRAPSFLVAILENQLKTLDSLLARYASNVNYLEGRLKETTKIRFQKPGRKAERQGRQSWAMIFDAPEYADIPPAIIQLALNHEGIDSVLPVEGPIYSFKLFNLGPEEYRIAHPCTVTEHTRAHGVILLHPYLGLERPVIEKIADAIEKVHRHAEDLKTHARKLDTSEAFAF